MSLTLLARIAGTNPASAATSESPVTAEKESLERAVGGHR